ncbi:MAG: DUF4652 domain-containing protein [Bacillota bacterium]|nr:DUF4652 domain-containing protein [Bacillota bacterium]
MRCSVFIKNLNSFIEDGLPYDLHDSMKKHMESCSDCRNKYETEEFINNNLRQAFSIDEIDFKSSRVEIIKNIDKKRYGKSPIKKLRYHMEKYKSVYGICTAAVIFFILVMPSVWGSLRSNLGDSLGINKYSIGSFNAIKNVDKKPGKILAKEIIGDYTLVIKKYTNSGEVVMQLVDNKDNVVYNDNLQKDFGQKINFDNEFTIHAIDYNGDGKLEFAIGQPNSDTGLFRYILYTVDKNKIEIVNFNVIMLVGEHIKGEYSPVLESNGYNSLVMTLYNDENRAIKMLYIWDRKEKQYRFERDLAVGEDSNNVTTFIKNMLPNNISIKEATPWLAAENNKYFACIEGKGPEGRKDGIGKVYIRDSDSSSMWSLDIPGKEKEQLSPTYIHWLDNERLYVIVENDKSSVPTGGAVYIVNVEDGKTTLFYKSMSTQEQILSITQNGYASEMIIKVFEDANFNKFHLERVTSSLSNPSASKAELIN